MISADSSPHTSGGSDGGGSFPHTRWTLIAGVQQNEDVQLKERALSELCRIYWYPIYVVLRKKGCSPQDAEDLTQELFARMLKHESFSRANPELGKLRTYLLTNATRLATEMWRKKSAAKRGSGQASISIDAETAEEKFLQLPAAESTPESLFDKRWAMALLKEVELRMAKEYESRGKGEAFEILKPCLAGNTTDQHGERGYAGIAKTLGISVPALRAQIFRLREKFRKLTREEVAATLTDPTEEQVNNEMQHLYSALRQA